MIINTDSELEELQQEKEKKLSEVESNNELNAMIITWFATELREAWAKNELYPQQLDEANDKIAEYEAKLELSATKEEILKSVCDQYKNHKIVKKVGSSDIQETFPAREAMQRLETIDSEFSKASIER